MDFIICIDTNGGFAKDNKIPWDNKDDMKHFVAKTKNKTMLCGRNTFNSLPINVQKRAKVVSRNDNIERYCHRDDVIAIGGKKFMLANKNRIRKLWLTILNSDYHCDYKFKEIFDITRNIKCVSMRTIKGGIIYEYVF